MKSVISFLAWGLILSMGVAFEAKAASSRIAILLKESQRPIVKSQAKKKLKPGCEAEALLVAKAFVSLELKVQGHETDWNIEEPANAEVVLKNSEKDSQGNILETYSVLQERAAGDAAVAEIKIEHQPGNLGICSIRGIVNLM